MSFSIALLNYCEFVYHPNEIIRMLYNLWTQCFILFQIVWSWEDGPWQPANLSAGVLTLFIFGVREDWYWKVEDQCATADSCKRSDDWFVGAVGPPWFFLGLKGPPADYHLCDRGCQAIHIVLLYWSIQWYWKTKDLGCGLLGIWCHTGGSLRRVLP